MHAITYQPSPAAAARLAAIDAEAAAKRTAILVADEQAQSAIIAESASTELEKAEAQAVAERARLQEAFATEITTKVAARSVEIIGHVDALNSDVADALRALRQAGITQRELVQDAMNLVALMTQVVSNYRSAYTPTEWSEIAARMVAEYLPADAEIGLAGHVWPQGMRSAFRIGGLMTIHRDARDMIARAVR